MQNAQLIILRHILMETRLKMRYVMAVFREKSTEFAIKKKKGAVFSLIFWNNGCILSEKEIYCNTFNVYGGHYEHIIYGHG